MTTVVMVVVMRLPFVIKLHSAKGGGHHTSVACSVMGSMIWALQLPLTSMAAPFCYIAGKVERHE